METKKIVLIITILLCNLLGYSQDSLKVTKEWANVGLGFAKPYILNGVGGFNASVNYQRYIGKNYYQ